MEEANIATFVDARKQDDTLQDMCKRQIGHVTGVRRDLIGLLNSREFGHQVRMCEQHSLGCS